MPIAPVDTPRKLLDIAVQIADGLAAAHAASLIHRDLKPDNILITRDGRVKILDFGLARAAPHEELAPDDVTLKMAVKLTDPGTTIGTIAYMSPEQARGQANLGPQSDQFSLGLVLYELAAGKRAFQRGSSAEIMTAIIREDAEPLPASVPAPFRWIVERLLAKEPAERYDSTRDLYRELRQVRDRSRTTTESRAAAPQDAGMRRRRILPWMMAVPFAGAIGAAWYLGRATVPRPRVDFRRITFRRGYVTSARYSPDGQTIIYGAAWGGEGLRLYSGRPDQPEYRALDLPLPEMDS